MPLPPSFRLIDTSTRCVVECAAPVAYLALSYVLGAATLPFPQVPFQLELSNIDELAQPSALRRRISELPAVIIDAMNFCTDIGHRFLWVDRLCIVQDDCQSKLAQINAIDAVY